MQFDGIVITFVKPIFFFRFFLLFFHQILVLLTAFYWYKKEEKKECESQWNYHHWWRRRPISTFTRFCAGLIELLFTIHTCLFISYWNRFSSAYLPHQQLIHARRNWIFPHYFFFHSVHFFAWLNRLIFCVSAPNKCVFRWKQSNFFIFRFMMPI